MNQVLEERLNQLTRRSQQRPDSSDEDHPDEDDDSDTVEQAQPRMDSAAGRQEGGDVSRQTALRRDSNLPADEAADWERLAHGQLSAKCCFDCDGLEWGLGEYTARLRK